MGFPCWHGACIVTPFMSISYGTRALGDGDTSGSFGVLPMFAASHRISRETVTVIKKKRAPLTARGPPARHQRATGPGQLPDADPRTCTWLDTQIPPPR